MNFTKILIYGNSFLLFIFCSINSTAQTEADEYMAISETLSYYLDGGTYNDFPRLEKAFHKDATMKFIGDQYKAVNAIDFFQKGIKPGPPQDRTTKIISIQSNGHAANAVLRIDYPTSYIIDFMNLLKVDGTWKIVNKIFYVEKLNTDKVIEDELSVEEKEVLSVFHRWKMAYINKNTSDLEAILADNWSYAGSSNGKLGNKEGAIADTKNVKNKVLAVNFRNLKTYKAGEVIIVNGQEELITEANGKTNANWLMFTDIYQKIDGRWQAISTHSSEMK